MLEPGDTGLLILAQTLSSTDEESEVHSNGCKAEARFLG